MNQPAQPIAPDTAPPDTARAAAPQAEIIFVDLDGTLARTDLFFESLLRLARHNPLKLAATLLATWRNRARGKALAAYYAPPEADLLPYDEALLAHLKAAKARGAKLVLTTAAHRRSACRVARHLDLFDDVIATARGENLKGARKLARMREFTDAPFAYAGDSPADAPIWDAAAEPIFVNAPKSQIARARAQGKPVMDLSREGGVAGRLLKAMRPHQWAKNALIFVPLFSSHSYGEANAVIAAAIAFAAFSLCASGVYLINDLLDLDADRRHPTKRNRPFASGAVFPPIGVGGALTAFIAAFAAAFFVSPAFVGVLIIYLILTTLYSLWLKRKSTLDVITLAALYTLRILAGGAAIGVAISFWLLSFSMFFFLSLAYLKRYSELTGGGEAAGRGYDVSDAETVFVLGAGAGLMSVLVIALYIDSDFVRAEYPFAEALWLICPALLYWINRIWVGARRGKINEDPVVFALRDRVSLAVLGFCAAAAAVARYADPQRLFSG